MIDVDLIMREFAASETSELLEAAAKGIRKAASDPTEEAVHKMRVAIRRFQQSLRLFGQFFRPKGVRRVKADLDSVMKPAGELRNCDIALKLTGARSSAARVLRARRSQFEATLVATLAQVASETTAARWTDQLEGGAKKKGRSKKDKKQKKLWRGRRTVADNLRRTMPQLVNDYFDNGSYALQPARSWEEMHHFRLLTKRFRYTLELLRPAYGKALESKIELLRQVQTMLGDINDAVVTSGILTEIAGTERIRARLAVKADRLTHELRALWTARFADPSRRTAWTRYLVQYACRTRPAAPGAARPEPAAPENPEPEPLAEPPDVSSTPT